MEIYKFLWLLLIQWFRFLDGNGRTARLWQTVILAHWKDLFKYIPIESIIRKHQEEYYIAQETTQEKIIYRKRGVLI